MVVSPITRLVLDGLALCSPRDGGCVERVVKKQLRGGSRSAILTCNQERLAVSSALYGITAERSRLAFLSSHVRSSDAGLTPEERRRRSDARLLAIFLRHGQPQRMELAELTSVLNVSDTLPGSELDRINDLDLAHVRWPAEEVHRIALVHSLPTALVRSWADVLPTHELEALGAACSNAGPVVLRANLRKCSRGELAHQLRASGIALDEGVLASTALRLHGGRAAYGGSIWSLPQWKAGWCEVQDEGSQCVALATEAQPGERVLDMCAGNGGKSLALAAMVGEDGHVVAHDVVHARLRALEANAERAGVAAQVDVVAGSDEDVQGEVLQRHFQGGGTTPLPDVVLVDAPCSSSGVIRRHPGLRWSKQWAGGAEAPALQLPDLQLRLLTQAAALLPVGGRLVYATCALERSQNEAVAQAFEVHGGSTTSTFTPWAFDCSVEGVGEVRHHRTLWPHRHGTDGFFIARWKRTA